jgi:hypothetical protein
MKQMCFVCIILLVLTFLSCDNITLEEYLKNYQEPEFVVITIKNLPSHIFPEGTMLYIGYYKVQGRFFARGNNTVDSDRTAVIPLHNPNGTPVDYRLDEHIYILKDIRGDEILYRTKNKIKGNDEYDNSEKNITIGFYDFQEM